MNVAVFACSQSLHEPALDFYRSILRKTAIRYPDLTVRVSKSLGGHAADLVDFCDALDLTIEHWAPNSGFGNYASDIRIKAMLRGYEFDPETIRTPARTAGEWPVPIRVEPPADLCLIFSGKSTGDSADDVAKAALKMGSRLALHVYKEKWSKKKQYKEQAFQGQIVHKTRHKRKTFTFDTKTSLVWTPEQERKAA